MALAGAYSMAGLRAAWRGEAAFRTECIAIAIALPVAAWIAEDVWQFTALIGSMLLVMIVEIINSAIEAVVDRIGTERHPLSGQAKDLGSAAVMLATILSLMIWAAVIVNRFT
ncbi:MAG: diacylglycerol kinase [Pseudomonadota bacterium]